MAPCLAEAEEADVIWSLLGDETLDMALEDMRYVEEDTATE